MVELLGVEVVETWRFEETFLKVFFVFSSKSMCGYEEPLLLWLAMRYLAHVEKSGAESLDLVFFFKFFSSLATLAIGLEALLILASLSCRFIIF